MSKLTKNTEMTAAQKTAAFEAVGSYMKMDENSETTVDAYNEGTKQIIVKVKTKGMVYFVVIGALGKIINNGWV
jgi:peptidyl-tRNA hydrolase